MTLKEKRNHYNVKFLKGCGHYISVKDPKIILKNCADPFSSPEIESRQQPQSLEQFIESDKIQYGIQKGTRTSNE